MYAGQNKRSKEIEAKVKKELAKSQTSKDKAANIKKIHYYNKFRKNNPENIMKSTLTPQIDIVEIEEHKGVYTVAYWDENFIGDNNVTIQITEAKLLEYVANEYPAAEGDLLTDKEYLELDKEAIIKDYITANS